MSSTKRLASAFGLVQQISPVALSRSILHTFDGIAPFGEVENMNATLEVIGQTVRLEVPQEHGNSVHVIIGGADGTLITIDAQGHIHVRPPEGPGPTEAREAVSRIIEAVGVIGKAAQVELNPQPIPPGRERN